MTDAQKLADEYEAGLKKCAASGYEEYGPDFQQRQQLIIDALRFYAPQALAATPAVGGEELTERLEMFADHGAPTMIEAQEIISDALLEIDRLRAAQPASPLRGEHEKELFDAATKIDLGAAVRHLRNWQSYISDHHRQTYADLLTAQGKLIAWLLQSRAASPPEQPAAATVTGLEAVREAHEAFDRMLRNNVIEECAEIAEDFPDSILHLVDRPGGPPGNFRRGINGKDIATAIRALSPAAPDKKTSMPWIDAEEGDMS